MRFKEFLITESMGIIAKDLGVVLTSLQEYLNVLNDLEKIPKESLNSVCTQAFYNIKGIIRSGNLKENSTEVSRLQRICSALDKIISNDKDFSYKDYFPKIISNLEEVIKSIGLPINKLASADTSEPKDSDSLGATMKSAKDKPPEQPKDVTAAVNPTEPNTQADQLYAEPLGGSSGPLSAF
jgi:hypothetical protein